MWKGWNRRPIGVFTAWFLFVCALPIIRHCSYRFTCCTVLRSLDRLIDCQEDLRISSFRWAPTRMVCLVRNWKLTEFCEICCRGQLLVLNPKIISISCWNLFFYRYIWGSPEWMNEWRKVAREWSSKLISSIGICFWLDSAVKVTSRQQRFQEN